MQTFARSIMVTALMMLPAAQLGAQTGATVERGDRIRVKGPWGSIARVGTIEAVTSDSLTLRLAPTYVERIATADVTKVERSAGQRRPFVQYALVGLLAGAAAGAVLGAATYKDTDGCLFACSRGDAAGMVGVMIGAVGLVVGGIAGLSPRDSWRPASLPVSAGHSSGGFTLGLSYSMR